jgi:hypothetical protein
MIPVETIPGMRERRMVGMVEGVDSSTIYLIHCKNFCKCHSAHPLNTTI